MLYCLVILFSGTYLMKSDPISGDTWSAMDIDIQAVESKLSDVTVTAIPPINAVTVTVTNTPNSSATNNNNNKDTQPGQSKYAQLLGVIEEMGREVRPTYAGSRSSAERLKRGIVHARILVRECLMETERSARQ